MSSLGELWDSLRRAGLESLAPSLVRHGVTSVNQLVLRFDELHEAGLLRWQLEAVMASSKSTAAGLVDEGAACDRADLPVRAMGKRANLQAALEAALPNQRQKSLQALDGDILAKSTNPATEARIRTYMAICRAWEIQAFPLDCNNVRCFGASLKAGGYKSAAVYYQAIMGHQQRTLRTTVPPIVKLGVRDCIRSIQRGLGVSKLKDSFNGMLIGNLDPVDDAVPFSLENPDHTRDMAVMGLWFMLRESEMAGARSGDVRLDGREVSLTIPLHKTDCKGRYTQRTLSCSCGVRNHTMCVWHSTERHLVRLDLHPQRGQGAQFPLFPAEGGRTASKQEFIEAIRGVIQRTGTPLTRPGPDGVETHRFHGHSLRIAGAQMLSGAGVELALIQLLGRWTSTAVLRYTQDSALMRVPAIQQQVLEPQRDLPQPVHLQLGEPPQGHPVESSKSPPVVKAARPKALAATMRAMQVELEQMKRAISQPAQTFVFRPRAKILHKASLYEATNEPAQWRTPCGWSYGTRTFLRTTSEQDGSRKCKKCFDIDSGSSSSSDEASSEVSGLDASSASSADD